MMMMKHLLVALLAVALNGVFVLAGCQRMTFTLNLKPKFPPGLMDDYGCGDLEKDQISDVVGKTVQDQMEGLGYNNVAVSNVKSDNCPEYDCDKNPGDLCLPYCLDISFCIEGQMEKSFSAISVKHLAKIQQIEVDAFRAKLPECLGIKNKFMADMHFKMR